MTIKACFFGDSFVAGAGDSQYLGWVGGVSAAANLRGHDLTSYNLGIRGDTSLDVAARWRTESEFRWRADCEPLLVFSFGVNDAVIENGRTRVARGQTMSNTHEILYYAVKRAPCIFIGPPPIADQELNERVAFLSAGIRAHCEAVEVGFIDPFPELLGSSIWMSAVIAGDGAHPDTAGYAELAGIIDRSPAWRRHLP